MPHYLSCKGVDHSGTGRLIPGTTHSVKEMTTFNFTPSTAQVSLQYSELEVLGWGLELLTERTAERMPQMAADPDWQSGMDALVERLNEAKANLPAL